MTAPPAVGGGRSGQTPRPLEALGDYALALVRLAQRRLSAEWAGFPLYRALLDRPAANYLAFTPRDVRPVSVARGREILAGRLTLDGETAEIGVHGDPWDMPSPSRRFAVALHRFAWLPDLLAAGPEGEREALRLFVTWRAEFEPLSPFVWSAEILERRVVNLACGAHRMAPHASEQEARLLAVMLARQTRRLADIDLRDGRRAERLAAACMGAGALADPVGGALLRRLLARLAGALDRAVGADGGLASRSPQQGLELLYDLLTVDDLLTQRGVAPPPELSRAIDALSATTAYLKLRDGRLPRFQGGEAVDANTVDGALAQFDPDTAPTGGRGGYQRIANRWIEVLADVAAPARGVFSVTACDQPLALEIVCNGDRLITNTGWSPDGHLPLALRLAAGGSTASLERARCGRILTGLRGSGLGPRLVGAAGSVSVRLTETEDGAWLDLAHDGWADAAGLSHGRRLFLDHRTAELRGEDAFVRQESRRRPRSAAFAVRFHIAPGVQVSLARDERSVLLRGRSDQGWWLRNDAAEVELEPSLVNDQGAARRTTQIVLRGRVPPEAGDARVRWKLSPVDAAAEPARRRGKDAEA